ncbi:hypothetical protein QJS10_CPA08g00357 [Acorus calamus]|uniref:Desiccation-related protein PCC13-62 n=1 Tax=Acorus calamus TaxID=4465 RepID=A0AAV9E9U3_ACOCL|nr:hypothetical protein QJS10_CPA08g00357 [Acorus calamus]
MGGLAQQQTVLPSCDVELLQFALNFQFLEAEFFLYSSLGYGLDTVAPDLAKGGPSPIGVKKIVAGMLAIESGQDAAIRTLLYQRSLQRVFPYHFTVGVATDRISRLRDSLGRSGVKDSGLLARKNRTGGHSKGEIVVWGPDSLAYARTSMELLRIFYGTGNESRPGGFFPVGVRGTIGQALLPDSDVNTTCPL